MLYFGLSRCPGVVKTLLSRRFQGGALINSPGKADGFDVIVLKPLKGLAAPDTFLQWPAEGMRQENRKNAWRVRHPVGC